MLPLVRTFLSLTDYCIDTRLELNRAPIIQSTSCSHHYTEERTEIRGAVANSMVREETLMWTGEEGACDWRSAEMKEASKHGAIGAA